ncbi:hypothetical protein V8C35DRAFT_313225 [Trichoderma chlorosporum]
MSGCHSSAPPFHPLFQPEDTSTRRKVQIASMDPNCKKKTICIQCQNTGETVGENRIPTVGIPAVSSRLMLPWCLRRTLEPAEGCVLFFLHTNKHCHRITGLTSSRAASAGGDDRSFCLVCASHSLLSREGSRRVSKDQRREGRTMGAADRDLIQKLILSAAEPYKVLTKASRMSYSNSNRLWAAGIAGSFISFSRPRRLPSPVVSYPSSPSQP